MRMNGRCAVSRLHRVIAALRQGKGRRTLLGNLTAAPEGILAASSGVCLCGLEGLLALDLGVLDGREDGRLGVLGDLLGARFFTCKREDRSFSRSSMGCGGEDHWDAPPMYQ
jgi:hypothetical protein